MSKTINTAAYTADFIETNVSIEQLFATLEMPFRSLQIMQNVSFCVSANAAGAAC